MHKCNSVRYFSNICNKFNLFYEYEYVIYIYVLVLKYFFFPAVAVDPSNWIRVGKLKPSTNCINTSADT